MRLSTSKLIPLALVFTLLLTPLSAQALTVSEEIELGEKYMKQLRDHMRFIEDPVITRVVRRVGANILEQVPPQPFQYRFFVAQEDVYNAFAGPGGFVVINSGLLQALETEDQLAAIMSHEIAHVTCRHISERLEKGNKVQAATAAGLVASLLLGSPAGGVLSMATGSSVMLAYSRTDEAQADEIGMQYLLKAGYSGQGLVDALRILRAKTWFGQDQIPDYVTTHPAVEERMVGLSTWLQAHPEAMKTRHASGAYDYAKMRAKLAALYGGDADLALARFARAAESNGEDPIACYGYGLSLIRANQRGEAVQMMKRALSLSPFDSDILRDLGRAQFEAGQYTGALASLQGAVEAEPEGASGYFWLGRTHLESGDLNAAVQALETAREKAPDQEDVNYHLGQVYGRMQKLDKAHYHLGLFHLARRDLKNANFHLQKALTLAADDPELLDEIKKAMEELSRGMKKKDK